MDQQTLQHNSKHSNLPIGWFVAFSLLLHALLFWGVIHNEQQNLMPAAQQAASGLHITLASYQVPTQPHKAKPEKTPTRPPTRSGTVADEVATTNERKAKVTQVSESAFRERIMVKLQQAIAAHFIYPLLARQRNWQGEVVLEFRLERDGRISGMRVARSSGYSLLDHAALNALAQVERISEIMPRSLSVELPVIYRLEG